MKKLFAVMLALVAGSALAQTTTTTPTANAWETRFRTDLNNGVNVYYMVPDDAADKIATYEGGSVKKPKWVNFGTGLARSGDALNVALTSSQLTDSTATGQALMTASSAAAARAAIGAGTSSFDGAYASLAGIPSTFAPAAHTQAWSTITSTPTTLAGYGISDAYPLTGNPSGFLTGITGAQVTTALGLTPVNQAGARAAISLTTTGSGAATYNSATGVLNIPTPAASSGTVTSITAGTGLSGGTITTTGTISLPNTGTAGTYSGVTTDAQGRVTAGTARSFAYQTRALNSCFQVSAARDAFVTYSVDIATTATLASGQVGTVYLRTYSDSGCTSGAQEITRFVNGNTQTLGLSVTLVQNVTGTLTGIIPAGAYVQLVTQNNTGTPSFTARPGQEVLL